MTKPTESKLSEPAQARKLPRQQRSIELVRALKEACQRILENDGPEALTIAHLSEVSGVSTGSIYEYFPNIDAIFTAIFEDYMHEVLSRSTDAIAMLSSSHGLYEAVAVIVRQSLGMRKDLAGMYLAFYRRHIDYFEVIGRRGDETDPNSAFQTTRRSFERFRGEMRADDPDKIFFMFVRTLQFVTRAIVLEHDEYLDQADTATMLTDMLYGLLSGGAGNGAPIMPRPES